MYSLIVWKCYGPKIGKAMFAYLCYQRFNEIPPGRQPPRIPIEKIAGGTSRVVYSNILKAKIWKMAPALTPDRIQPMRRGAHPNRPTWVTSGRFSLGGQSPGVSQEGVLSAHRYHLYLFTWLVWLVTPKPCTCLRMTLQLFRHSLRP